MSLKIHTKIPTKSPFLENLQFAIAVKVTVAVAVCKLTKNNSVAGVLLWIFQKCLEELFCRASGNDCFWQSSLNRFKDYVYQDKRNSKKGLRRNFP